MISDSSTIWFMRNSPWGMEKFVFERIENSKKVICPAGHSKKEFDFFAAGNIPEILRHNKYGRERFVSEIKVGDIILMFHKGADGYLVLKVTSDPTADIIEDTFVLLQQNYEADDNYKPLFIGPFDKMRETGLMNGTVVIDNMRGITRSIEIIGQVHKLKSKIYSENATCQNSIWQSKKRSQAKLREMVEFELAYTLLNHFKINA